MLYIPKGLAHGFLALTEHVVFVYKCDQYYNKEAERGIIYNDPDLNIDWEFPDDGIILSDKDKELPALKECLI
jgi:dTDP-4-dehydrorhamnose 3,5-epimerase